MGENHRLKKLYEETAIPALKEEFNYTNPSAVPRLKKIVINCGVGETTSNPKAMDYVVYAIERIAGQKPVITRSKKAIAAFKLRENLPIGCMVTLRGERMYSFLDRLVNVALPRVRDFRGTPRKGFDGRGNYTFGMSEQIAFPEVDIDKLDKVRGMDITFVTSAETDDEARALLGHMGVPFRKVVAKVEEQ
jgi:large subunit ribosomal protein L5